MLIKTTNPFRSAREAKEFLISRIVDQAQREAIPLSEVERKMLYFSETHWTLPDIGTVSEQFDGTYDQDEYEQKIARLVKEAYKCALRNHDGEYERWQAAVRLLRKQDHYILVMIDQASLRPRGDQLRLFAAGIGIVALFLSIEFLALFLNKKYGIDMSRYWPSGERVGFLAWAVAVGLVILTTFYRYISRKAR